MREESYAGLATQDCINTLAGSIAERLLGIESRLESVRHAIDPGPTGPGFNEEKNSYDVPLRGCLNNAGYTINRIDAVLCSIEGALGIDQSKRTTGQQPKENGSMSFDLVTALTNPLVIVALRRFVRKEVTNMPRGFPGTGPRGNPALAPKASGTGSKKAATKAPAKAVAKKAVAKAPAKKAAPAKAVAKKKAA